MVFVLLRLWLRRLSARCGRLRSGATESCEGDVFGYDTRSRFHMVEESFSRCRASRMAAEAVKSLRSVWSASLDRKSRWLKRSAAAWSIWGTR